MIEKGVSTEVLLIHGAFTVSPVAGRDYPRSYAELRAWFDQDGKCLDYLDWLRWPDGFVCPGCGSLAGWRLSDARWLCGACKRKVSATAGTIFDKTRTPLTVWFTAACGSCRRSCRRSRRPSACRRRTATWRRTYATPRGCRNQGRRTRLASEASPSSPGTSRPGRTRHATLRRTAGSPVQRPGSP